MNEPKAQQHVPEVIEDESFGLAVRETVGGLPAPTLDRLAQLDHGEEILARMGRLQETLSLTLLRQTEPEDWVRSKTRDGLVSAMPTKAATLKMARFLGLLVEGLDSPSLRPEMVYRGENGAIKGFRVEFRYVCANLRMEGTGEVTRWEDEDFTGRQVDASEKLVFRGERALESDLRSAARSAALNKAVKEVTGLGKVPDAMLERAWGQGKIGRCQLGHGFGRSEERQAEKVAEAGSKEDAEALWAELLRFRNGVVADAGKVLEEITVQADGKYAKKSIKAFTAGWQVKKAWERLESRPDYKAYRSGAAPEHEREPGEEG